MVILKNSNSNSKGHVSNLQRDLKKSGGVNHDLAQATEQLWTQTRYAPTPQKAPGQRWLFTFVIGWFF